MSCSFVPGYGAVKFSVFHDFQVVQSQDDPALWRSLVQYFPRLSGRSSLCLVLRNGAVKFRCNWLFLVFYCLTFVHSRFPPRNPQSIFCAFPFGHIYCALNPELLQCFCPCFPVLTLYWLLPINFHLPTICVVLPFRDTHPQVLAFNVYCYPLHPSVLPITFFDTEHRISLYADVLLCQGCRVLNSTFIIHF